MLSKILERPQFYILIPLLLWLIGKSFELPTISINYPTDRSAKPQLASAEGYVQQPEETRISTESERPARAPLRVTIPDLNAQKYTRKHTPAPVVAEEEEDPPTPPPKYRRTPASTPVTLTRPSEAEQETAATASYANLSPAAGSNNTPGIRTTPSASPTPLPSNVPEYAIKRWNGPDAVDQRGNAITKTTMTERTEDASEPKRDLSQETKDVIAKLPEHPARSKKIDPVPINIEHGKKTTHLDKAEPAVESKSHEAMGIKIDMKIPKVNVDYELEKAYNSLISGRTEAAIYLYKGVLEIDPNNQNALFGLATTFHRAGQVELARPLYAKLLSVNPNHRDGLNNFLVLAADEAPEEALKQLQSLRDTNPDFSPIPAQMAIIYQKLGKLDDANQNMLRAIELAPENLTYRYNFAIMLDKQHKYEEAAQLYEQIIQSYLRGEAIPGNIEKIQQRLTFISSNRYQAQGSPAQSQPAQNSAAAGTAAANSPAQNPEPQGGLIRDIEPKQ